MTKKKIVITTGGTGGHVYPAMGLADQLLKASPDVDLIFVGGGLHTNRYFDRARFPFYQVASKTLTFSKPWTLFEGGAAILKGTRQSYDILKTFNPDLVVGFGSYHTFPTLVAAKWLSLPIILHEANSFPGRVQRFMSPYVDITALHFPETASYLKGKCVEVGMPLREGFKRSELSQKEVRDYFGLGTEDRTLLVFGGSQGAQAINRLFLDAVGSQALPRIQVIHLTGDAAVTKEAKAIYAKYGVRACVKDYEDQMNLAWSAADLFIARAGASTIAEAMEFEVPGILIPYPYAQNHQEKNADFLVKTVEGGIKLLERQVDCFSLCQQIYRVFSDGKWPLTQMRESIRRYKNRPAQETLCSLVLRMLEDRSQEPGAGSQKEHKK